MPHFIYVYNIGVLGYNDYTATLNFINSYFSDVISLVKYSGAQF
jgi:hypothetical protein